MMNYIVAHTYDHAKYFAQRVMHFPKHEYSLVVGGDYRKLQGLRGVTVWFIEAPRHDTTNREHDYRQIAREIVHAQSHRLTIKEAVLP